jgi:uncharacterized linocin/CFP29 family protein
MDYLSREGSPISQELWDKIDESVTSIARKILKGRKFLNLYGPLGAGVQSINIDTTEVEEIEENPRIITGRRYEQLPLIYEDFSLLWRDLETSEQTGMPIDLSAAERAAVAISKKEDELIFFGNEKLKYEGILTAKGITKLQKGDWNEGENPVKDITAGLTKFLECGLVGREALILSPNVLLQLQRIQPGTGITEYERLSKLLNGNIFSTPVLGSNKVVLVNAEPQNMDLVIGQDIATSYLETKDLNHYFRIIETILPRIKNKDAVILFE